MYSFLLAHRPIDFQHKSQARPRNLEWTLHPSSQSEPGPGPGPTGLDLHLAFELGPGAYASVLLREVLGREPRAYVPPPWGGDGGGGDGEPGEA